MGGALKEMAKMAAKRMTSGFWQDKRNRRKEALAILEDKGADTTEARRFFVANTKHQINYEYNKEDEELYLRIKQILLAGETENALSVLIDPDEMEALDDSGKQRYIFNLSAKLQEFRERFQREREFDVQAMAK